MKKSFLGGRNLLIITALSYRGVQHNKVTLTRLEKEESFGQKLLKVFDLFEMRRDYGLGRSKILISHRCKGKLDFWNPYTPQQQDAYSESV